MSLEGDDLEKRKKILIKLDRILWIVHTHEDCSYMLWRRDMMEIVALYIVPCDVRVLTCFESG